MIRLRDPAFARIPARIPPKWILDVIRRSREIVNHLPILFCRSLQAPQLARGTLTLATHGPNPKGRTLPLVHSQNSLKAFGLYSDPGLFTKKKACPAIDIVTDYSI